MEKERRKIMINENCVIKEPPHLSYLTMQHVDLPLSFNQEIIVLRNGLFVRHVFSV